MAEDNLKIWCNTTVTDGVTNTDNKRTLLDEEYLNGWLRNGTVSIQQLNSLFFGLTLSSSPYTNSPYLMSDGVTTPSTAYDMDGTVTLTSTDAPNLYEIYGATLPDLSGDAPTGHKYVIRIS